MKKLYLSGWQIYSNLSGVSGVDLYDYDTINYSYITIKFKDGSIYSYTSDDNSINMIRAMATLAINGIGLNRYVTKNQPAYIKGTITQDNTPTNTNNRLEISTIKYPMSNSNISTINYNRGKNWVEVVWKNGTKKTYTSDVSGESNVHGIINAAIKGYGLQKFINENKPIAIEDSQL